MSHTLTVCLPLQEISNHQEQFIQMLNEPNPEAVPAGGGGGAGGVGGAGGTGGMAGDPAGGGQMSYIQVTPQEKEAIERVRSSTARSLTFPLSPKFRSL